MGCTAYGLMAEDDRGYAAPVTRHLSPGWRRCERGQLDLEQLLDVVMDALLL